MFRWQTLLGVVFGLAAGIAVLSLTGHRPVTREPSGPILSECNGHFRELVIHYEPSAKDITTTVYREFLGALPADVTVHVLCPDKAAYEDFQSTIGTLRCRISPVIAGHAMTTWSRDRWIALSPVEGVPARLWCPREEAGAELWPARLGDQRVALDLAAALPSLTVRRSTLAFDGGDFLADDKNVFVIPRLLQKNLQQTVASREELLKMLNAEFKKHVILLDEAPDHHAGMFMASVGNNTMLVGDPSLCRRHVPASVLSTDCAAPVEWMQLPSGPDFSSETQNLFDAVARQCAAAGYKVVRIPTIPGHDGRTYLTYVNCVLDELDGKRIVYLPYYRGAEALNDAARKVWENLGYEIRPVDCTSAYRHFGCLHCLVNVLRRG